MYSTTHEIWVETWFLRKITVKFVWIEKKGTIITNNNDRFLHIVFCFVQCLLTCFNFFFSYLKSLQMRASPQWFSNLNKWINNFFCFKKNSDESWYSKLFQSLTLTPQKSTPIRANQPVSTDQKWTLCKKNIIHIVQRPCHCVIDPKTTKKSGSVYYSILSDVVSYFVSGV